MICFLTLGIVTPYAFAMASALLEVSASTSAAVVTAPTALATSAAPPRLRARSLSLFLSRRPAACVASTPGDLRGAVFVGLGYRKLALQLLPLFALHSKARRKSAIAKDGEFDYGECDGGIYARGLEFLLVERDIVDHLERQHQQACCERHDECGRCDLGVCAVPLDAFLFLFGELLHGASTLIVFWGDAHTLLSIDE